MSASGGTAMASDVPAWRDTGPQPGPDRLDVAARAMASIAQATADAIVCADAQGRITFWNGAAQVLFGHTREEAVERSLDLIIPERLRERHWAGFAHVARGGAPRLSGRPVEVLARHRSGAEITVEVSFAVWPEDAGGDSAFGVGAIIRDVSERKRAGAALAASEARFRATFEQSAVGIAHIGLDGRWLRVNNRLCAMLGYTEAELLERTLRDITHPDDRRTDREDALRLLAGEVEGYSVEKRYLRKDGAAVWANSTLSLARDPSYGAPQYFIAVAQSVDDRKRAEAALRESEARFRALADNMAQLAWMADADGSIAWYNQRWHEYCGTTPEQMQGWGWQSVHDPEVLPSVLEHWRGSITTGAPFEMTFPLRGADGVFRPFLTRVEPIRDEGGRVTRWFGTNTDVTGQREVEAANAHLAAIVASSEDAIVSYAPQDGRVLSWNKGAEQLFGYAETEMVGGPATRLLPPDLPEDERGGLFTRAMAGHTVVAHETVRVSKNGERVPVSISVTQMLSPDGRVVGVSAIFRDLRPRLRAEAALRESEAQFRATFEQAAVGVAHVGLDGRWLRVNGRLCAMLGYTETELLARTFQEVTHPDDLEPNLAHVRRLVSGEVARFSTEKRYLRRDGSFVWAALTSALRRDPDSSAPLHLISVVEDITARKRAEERLHESEGALREAQKLEAIGRLAAGVAHDFNNILQGVSGALELVLDEVETGTPAHEFVQLALGSAKRGSTLTHHLLSYARKQMLQPAQLDLAPFLTDMQRLLARTLGPHIRVEALVDRATPSVEVDPGQLHTALLNLAINAAHAMPKSGTLSLDAREDSGAEQRWVVIAVTDTGMGMDTATLAQACEPFFTTKGADGTGLGLSMVQGFVEQSGGEMRIASAPGQGTTVQLRLPAAIAAASDGPEAQATSVEQQGGSGRVLLVDDVSEVLVTAGAFLERAGFQVSRAENGDQALALLAAGERFDALVSDYAMPGLNGLGLIEQVRAVQPNLPALLITGFAEVDSADTLPAAVAILCKPFQRRQLVEAVLHVLALGADADHCGNVQGCGLPPVPWTGGGFG